MVGQRFGRWTVMAKATPDTSGARWNCACLCGTTRSVSQAELRRGDSRSCGCLVRDVSRETCIGRNRTHGMSDTRTYNIWQRMLARCKNPASKDSKNYGARGIKVCERWNQFASFFADMGEAPAGHSIDRKNNDGDYELGNCRWANAATQNRNKRNNIFVRVAGKVCCFSDAAALIGANKSTVYDWMTRKSCTPQQAIDHYSRRAA